MMKLLKVKDGNVFTDKISKTLLIASRGSKIQKYVRLNIICLKSKHTQTHFMYGHFLKRYTNDSKLSQE